MRMSDVILACGLLMAGAAQAQDCNLKQYGMVDLHVVSEKVFVPVTLNGVQKEFELNIAGTFNRLTPEIADELKLPLKPLPSSVSFSGDAQFTPSVVVPEFQLGNIKLKDVEFLVLASGTKPGGMESTVGIGMLAKADLELDMGGAKMKLFSQDHCPGKVVYWAKNFSEVPLETQKFGFVRPKMFLDGHPMTVALSLNSHSEIYMDTLHKEFDLDETSPGMTLQETTAQGIKIYKYPFKTLGTEDLKIGNPAIRVVALPPGPDCSGHTKVVDPVASRLPSETPGAFTCYGGGDLVLGYSILSKLHMYFSMKEKLMYLTGADAH